jgi:glycerol-3-phosphate dehydrogenase (NAD(P)+)
MQLTILGAGSWGTALAILAARNGHNVWLWGHDADKMTQMQTARSNIDYLPGLSFPADLQVTSDLASAMQNSRIFVIAVPSHVFSDTFLAIKPYLQPHHGCLIATKGLDPVSGDFFTQVVTSRSDFPIPVAVLSGPTFAKEIAAGQPSAIALASLSDDFSNVVVTLLHNTCFRVYRTQDVLGVQLGGVVKNVLAIAAGIAEGLGFGANTQAALLTRGLAEMVRLGLAVGGQLETFLGLAGVGDLILTATNNQSRNRRFGLLVGQGIDLKTAEQQIKQVVEGVYNAKQICQLAAKYQIEMPITQAVHAILAREISPKEAVNQLLMREPKREGV